MKKTIVKTTEAPAALGPYSQGVLVEGGRTLYIAGQLPIDPQSGNLAGDGDIRIQTERVLDNIGAILKAAGMDFDALVKVGIFLANFDDFGDVNSIYERRFSDSPPARTTVQIARFPKGFLIEIDAIAVA
ncbi:MAG: Rid family detoxifying hydrolase [Desulfobacterales bacterium]|jgi:2-iminobutanoate/2-iminopropanoate deaminase